MKKYIYISMALAATMFTACSSDDALDNIENGNQTVSNAEQEFTIIANLPKDGATRMAGTDENNIMKFDWESGDQVRFYYYYDNSGTSTYNTFDRSISNTETMATDGFAKFSLGTRPGQNCYVYASWVNFSTSNLTVENAAAETATVYVNSQNRVYNTTDDVADNNPMFGAVYYTSPSGSVEYDTEGVLNFKTVSALLKLTLTLPSGHGSNITDVKIQQWSGTKASNPVIRRYYRITGSTNAIDKLVDTDHEEKTGGYSVTGKAFAVTDDKITLYAIVHPQEWAGLCVTVKDDSATPNTYYYKKTGTKTLETGNMYRINGTMTIE